MTNGKVPLTPDNNGFARSPGKNSIGDWDTQVIIKVQQGYEAYSKDLPGDLPVNTPRTSEPITWFNNFEVRSKNWKQGDPDPQYDVYLADLPDDPREQGRKRRVCFFINNQVIELTPGRSDIPGKVKYTLTAGDPPTGTIP